MSEYWKSTERYWCKHCACYVRDTKLERQNHDATARHQGALKRFLRDLHRNHEQEERNKERARLEIDRLNGVVSGSSTGQRHGATGATNAAPSPGSTPGAPSDSDLKKQREQLAQMGVQMPETFRPEMAMPGQWTVTNTRVIEPKATEEKIDAKASGVRKREVAEEDKEEEEAVKGLFKKQKRWGRNSKMLSQVDDPDLDSLLSGSIVATKAEAAGADDVKKEEDTAHATTETTVVEQNGAAKAEPAESLDRIKSEPDEAAQGLDAESGAGEAAHVKTEGGEPAAGAVVFKKRKAKNIRQR